MANLAVTGRTDVGSVLRAAHEADPSHPGISRRLARYLYNSDFLDELVRDLGPTLGDAGADPECLHFVGLAASQLGDHDLAERALSRAVVNGHAGSLGPLARTLQNMNRTADAYSAGMRTLKTCPDDDSASQVVFSILLAERRYAEVWDLCSRLRAAGGWTARMISAMALSAKTPDQIALAQRITDQDTWMECTPLGLDQEHVADFGRDLISKYSWTGLPRRKATVGGGRRIEDVQFIADQPFIDQLFSHIREAIANYVEVRADLFLPKSIDHPMTAMRPDRLVFSSWIVAVNMDGHEEWHIHPDGWLSGVFYVDVPDLSGCDAPKAGQVEFGAFPLGPPSDARVWPAWTIRPRTGDLMLFPSYFAHRTWPTDLDQDRICVAFDVLRQGLENPAASSGTERVRAHIGIDDRFVRDGRVVSVSNPSGSQVILNVDGSEYLVLDEVTSLLWECLVQPRTARELTAIFLRDFNGIEEEIARDITSVLDVMVSCGVATSV